MAKFKVQKGYRVKKGTWRRNEPGKRSPMFIGLEPVDPFTVEGEYPYPKLLWCKKMNRWYTHKEFNKLPKNTFYCIKDCLFGDSMNGSIKSLKAAEAHLRRHDEIPKGMRFTLVSFFPEYDIELVKK